MEINQANYYEGVMIDVRNTFIGYGRWLEKNKINGQGSIDNYVHYLELQEQETNDEEYLDFISYLLEAENDGNDIIIIEGEAWDEFHSTDDEDYEMKIISHFDALEFYEEFSKIVGIDKSEFDRCFVSAKYIDENTEKSVNLIVNINGINKTFIIDRI